VSCRGRDASLSALGRIHSDGSMLETGLVVLSLFFLLPTTNTYSY
jgi:hypothetical protein